MNIYKARWNKAKALALQINQRRDEATKECGNEAILLWRGRIIEGGLVIEDDTIYVRDGGCIFGVFDNNTGWDHGSHTSIKEIEEQFKEFEIYTPYRKD